MSAITLNIEVKPLAWAVWDDGGDSIQQFNNEAEAREAYKQAHHPIVADFIHLSPLFSVGEKAS